MVRHWILIQTIQRFRIRAIMIFFGLALVMELLLRQKDCCSLQRFNYNWKAQGDVTHVTTSTVQRYNLTVAYVTLFSRQYFSSFDLWLSSSISSRASLDIFGTNFCDLIFKKTVGLFQFYFIFNHKSLSKNVFRKKNSQTSKYAESDHVKSLIALSLSFKWFDFVCDCMYLVYSSTIRYKCFLML